MVNTPEQAAALVAAARDAPQGIRGIDVSLPAGATRRLASRFGLGIDATLDAAGASAC